MSNDHDDLRQRLRSSLDHGVAPDLSPDVVNGAAEHVAPHLTNPARTLRIAGASGLAIAAVAVGALVLGPGVVPAPLFTAAGGSPEAASLGASDAMTSDSRMMLWVERHYTADASLSTAGGSGSVYRLVLDASDPKTRTAELAQALGVDGAVTKADNSDPAYPIWVVGPQDGSGVNLNYGAFGTGDWWFNDPTVASFYLCDPSVTTADAERQGCVLPADAPENQAPTGDTARSLAKALFASTGYTVSAADIEISSSIDGTNASAYLTVDGVKTGLGWGAYWTNTGDLAYAFGHSVKPEARGTFNTVSPTDAVKRLDDYRWYGAAGPDYQGGAIMYATGGPVDDSNARLEGPVGASGSDAEPGGGSESQPTDEASVPPVDEPTDTATEEPVDPPTPAPEETLPPIEVDPKPEVVEITVDNATATLVLMWDADGNAWLVPGYAMEMPEGWWSAVVSLVEGVIALPDQG